MIEMVCRKCGAKQEHKVEEFEKVFAENTNSKRIVVVWVCPQCGSDNSSLIEVSD